MRQKTMLLNYLEAFIALVLFAMAIFAFLYLLGFPTFAVELVMREMWILSLPIGLGFIMFCIELYHHVRPATVLRPAGARRDRASRKPLLKAKPKGD
mmetsp:Transcript_74805/g.212996  ORF Transcript_74805/g.212996 Transcript_74805/m.212996 type:complete len:97 (-) Transcript_74805:20-310(-)